MRIIAGTLRGRNVELPSDSRARPTPDRAREALFSILGDSFSGGAVLDLFAGSGVVGFEALSRGAKSAVFVESGLAEARSILESAKRFGVEREVELLRLPAVDAVRRLRSTGRQFRLVFADPPWNLEAGPEAALSAGDLVAPGGAQVIEMESSRPRQRFVEERWDLRAYGRVTFAIRFRESGESSGEPSFLPRVGAAPKIPS